MAVDGFRGDWLKRGQGFEGGAERKMTLSTEVVDQRVNTRFLMQRYNVVDRTIDRWVDDPKLDFPKPLKINNRRYWRLSEILEWEANQESSQQHEETAA